MWSVALAKNMMNSIIKERGIKLLQDIHQHGEELFQHSIGVSSIGLALGKFMGLPPANLSLLGKCCLFHDAGKLLVDPNVLYKKGKLNNSEFEQVQSHTILGSELIGKNTELPSLVCESALYHHEKINGEGYPYKKKASSIHPLIRLITIVDIFDAVRAKRVYRDKVYSLNEVFRLLDDEVKKGLLDKDYVAILKKMYSEEEWGGAVVNKVKVSLINEINRVLKLDRLHIVKRNY